MLLFFLGFQPGCSYKRYKKKGVEEISIFLLFQKIGLLLQLYIGRGAKIKVIPLNANLLYVDITPYRLTDKRLGAIMLQSEGLQNVKPTPSTHIYHPMVVQTVVEIAGNWWPFAATGNQSWLFRLRKKETKEGKMGEEKINKRMTMKTIEKTTKTSFQLSC